jgi:glycine betaine/proline transport system ATP-binding protein
MSASVNRGEIFCIMGLSGSGKSTLVRHFNRCWNPPPARSMIEGTDVMALGPKELQTFRNRKIGMVFQNFALMPHRSVLDNVAMPLEIRQVSKNDRMRQAAAFSTSSNWAPGATSLPMSCRAACSNAWALPARWPPTRTCC